MGKVSVPPTPISKSSLPALFMSSSNFSQLFSIMAPSAPPVALATALLVDSTSRECGVRETKCE